MSDTPFGFDDHSPKSQRAEIEAASHWPQIRIGNDIAIKIIGVKQGGMGTIFIGHLSESESTKFAIKAFDGRWFFSPEVRQAFQREIGVWLQLSDTPFVFSALEVTIVKGIPHVVMPLVEAGEDGAISVGDLVRGPTKINEARIFEIALAVAMGLDAANAKVPGLVHGDIKPDNILLPGGVPHVSDFGLAQALNTAHAADYPAGTPEYLAPEIWNGKPRQITADIYAYGCMLYELLSGAPPYGRDRTKLRDAHCDAPVPPTPDTTKKSLSSGLAELSVLCLAKEPGNRPQSFKTIIGGLLEIGTVHAPETTTRYVQYVVGYDEIGEALAGRIDGGRDAKIRSEENRIASLLEAGEIDVALKMLTSTPVEDLSLNSLVMTGSALSLSGNDEKALEYFDRALQQTPDADTKTRCLSEKGLSLRRLERYEEALAIYDGLVQIAPDSQMKTVLANYAGTLLDAGRLREAEQKAQWLVQRVPDEANIWTLMGQIRVAQEQFEEAIGCFTRACRLDPGMVRARFERGVLLLERRLDVEGALADFDFTFGQNYHPRGLLVRLIAVNLLLGKQDDAFGLMRAIDKKDSELAIGISREALSLVTNISEKLEKRDSAKPIKAQSSMPAKRVGVLTAAWTKVKDQLGQTRRTTTNIPAQPKSVRIEGALLLDENGSPKKLLAYRVYVAEAWAALDYYNDPSDPQYAEAFGKGVRAIFRLMIDQAPGLTIRSSPFSFVRCATCAHELMTNRVPGEQLLCRRCDTKGPVEISSTAGSQDLIRACELAAGFARHSLTGRSIILIIWTSPILDRKYVEERCRNLGWTQHPISSGIARILADAVASRGYGNIPQEHLLLSFKCSDSDYIYEDGGTPWPVQNLVIGIAEKCGRPLSASMIANDQMMRIVFESAAERIGALRTECGNEPTDPEARGLLIKCLAVEGQLEEASSLVPPGSRWAMSSELRLLEGRGVLAHRLGQLAEARDLLEQARDRAPLDVSVRAYLLDVYREQDEAELARAELNQIRSIGSMLLG